MLSSWEQTLSCTISKRGGCKLSCVLIERLLTDDGLTANIGGLHFRLLVSRAELAEPTNHHPYQTFAPHHRREASSF